MKDLIEQFKSAIEEMERQQMDYDELHLSKEDCQLILILLEKGNS